jgi:hypothetical protein
MEKQENKMSDVWDSAANTTVAPKVYFGRIFTEAFYVRIDPNKPKGQRKSVFDEAHDPVEERKTQFKIDGVCTKADGSTYEIHKELICEFGRDWAGIVLPSLKVCNVHPRDLNEKWAKWTMVETGRTYTNDYGTHQATTFKFLEFYPDEAACRAAETAHYSRGPTEDAALDSSHPMPEEPSEEAPTSDAQREVAAKFLPALWKTAGGDVTKFSELIAGNPLTSKFFDLTSPEVIELVAAGVGEAA